MDPLSGGILGGVSVVAAVVGLYKKYGYKSTKWMIYSLIRKGINELDYDSILKGYEMLKKFDDNFTDKLTGRPYKKIMERLLCIERKLKSEKTEKLFNITKDILEDQTKLRKWLNDQKILKETDKTKTLIEKEMGVIEEEEKKENEAVKQMLNEIEVMKQKKLHKLALLRKMIDEANITDILEEQAEEYKQIILSKVQNDFDFQKKVMREQRKQQLEEKQKKIEQLKSMSNVGV